MGYLKIQETDLLKLPSNPDYWVRMRTRAPWGARIDAQGHMIKLAASGTAAPVNGGDPKVEVTTKAEWAAYMRALILGFITEWNLTDLEDRPLPINEDSLNLLDDDDGQFLANQAQARSKGRSVENERNLGTNSRQRSSTAKR